MTHPVNDATEPGCFAFRYACFRLSPAISTFPLESDVNRPSNSEFVVLSRDYD